MFAVLLVQSAGECYNVNRQVGLPAQAPHLAYMYALSILDQYSEYSPNYTFTGLSSLEYLDISMVNLSTIVD
jgi:hypothetical protein